MADFADTSGIKNAIPSGTVQQLNPLQTLSTIQTIQNQQMQNRLWEQDLLNKRQELENLKLTNQSGQTDLGQKMRVNAFNSLITLNRLDDPNMLKEAPGVLAQLKSANNLPPALEAQVQQDIQNGDAGALRTHISNGLSLLNPDLRQSVLGSPTATVIPGGKTQWQLIPGPLSAPGTQAVPLGQPVGGGLTPAEAAQRVTGPPTATGAPTTVPLGTVTPTSMGGTGGGPAAPASGGGGGGQSTSGRVVTGLPSDWDANVKQGVALNMRADQSPQIKAQLTNLSSDLSRINLMGPGADKDAAVNALVNKYTGYGIYMTPDQIAAADNFRKIATQIAMAQAQQGHATDAQTASSMMASPNLDLSKLSNEQIIARLQGNEDYILAKNQAWNEWQQGHGAGDYKNFSQWFAKQTSPVVFQHENMAAKEAQQFRASVPVDMKKLREDAIRHGWMARRQGEQAP